MGLPVAAIDFGATSVRVAVVDLEQRPLVCDVVHRVPHAPVRWGDGSLRWDWPALLAAAEEGVARAGPVASIGVDTWGVDYGLLDAGGRLLSPPYSYRDDRTEAWGAVAERIGRGHLYRTTGIQLMAINTVFQLAAHDRRELDRASRLLMVPELVVHHLTGRQVGERTSAGTTGLVDARTGAWSAPLAAAVGVDPAILPALAEPGTAAGTYRGVPVHLVGGHDTASAVAARPGRGAAFVSSGTWLIVGVERAQADVSDAARAANFSNEPAVGGGFRLLRNVTGFWLLEGCRKQWGDLPAGPLPPPGPVIDVDDPSLAAPPDMEAAVRALADLPAGKEAVVRCIIDSMCAGVARVLDDLRALGAGPIDGIDLLGGGTQVEAFIRRLEEVCGVPVYAGPAEATAIGNALMQGVALGRFASLTEARTATRQ